MNEQNFTAIWKGLAPIQKQNLATKAGTSVSYLSQVANGHRSAGLKTVRGLSTAIGTEAVFNPDFFLSPKTSTEVSSAPTS